MAASFGAFGKIPAMGDFFRLNLAQGFVEAWDEWLQAAMIDARARLGPAWTERYMTAPIWRFAVPPGPRHWRLMPANPKVSPRSAIVWRPRMAN